MSRHAESIEAVRRYYDALGEDEWERLTHNVRGRVSFEVHRGFLRRFVHPGSRVLEVGAGPGRFTLELAATGASIVVTDISEVQLALNETHLRGSEAERSVERRELLDVCDTGRYRDGEFDAVVAIGGPLSYAFERTDEAMAGLLRLVAPDGVVVASVMSWLGEPGASFCRRSPSSSATSASRPPIRSCERAIFATPPGARGRTSAACFAGATCRRSSNAPAAACSARARATGHRSGTGVV